MYIVIMVFQNQWLMRKIPSFHKCCQVKYQEQDIELVKAEEVGCEQGDQLPDQLGKYDHNGHGLNCNGNMQDSHQGESQPVRNDYCSV